MIYPSDFESKIGFDSIRIYISEKCRCAMGRELASEMSFSTDYDEILSRLRRVEEMMSIIKGNLSLVLDPVHDAIPWLNEIRAAGAFMSAERLFKLNGMLSLMKEVKDFFSKGEEDEDAEGNRFPFLKELGSEIALFPLLSSDIERCINKFGEVKDSASPELAEIRKAMRGASGSMQRAMRRVLDNAVSKGLIDKDVTPSVRDGRLVIPVSAANKRGIPGILHDESATGKTVFIEPSEVVEAGNRLRQLEMDERREIVTILRTISDDIRPYIDELASSIRVLGEFDFIRAKAEFAVEVDAQMPVVEKEPLIEWYHAVHPGLLLALRSQNRSVVPLYLTLSSENRILIISGPNAGGKSVCLKTVAIIQYMMQCGVMPTVHYNSHLGVFRNLLIDIGDEQSFENDLSTYSSHLKNMKFFLNNTDKRTLFLADEMGSGTEPQIGGALAQAILKSLGSRGCRGVVTTHYQNLKTFADQEPGFVNGAMLYDREHLQPTFQLSIGTPGSSFAIDIASKIGLPKDLIEEAKEIVGSDYVSLDKYLSEIQRDRRYWANKRQNIREKEAKLDNLLSKYEETAGDLKTQRKTILNEAKKEAKEILATANAKIERTILEIRKAEAEKEKTKQLRKELDEFKKDLENPDTDSDKKQNDLLKPLRHKSRKSKEKPVEKKVTVAPKELKKDDYVKMKDGNTVGQILSVDGKNAEVAFGALRTIVAVSKLEASSKPKQSALSTASTLSSSTISDSRSRQLNFKNEIDVRGMRADEALQAVTYFIDDALQFGSSRVRILHGTGHGILKTLIRVQLRANNAVRHFEDEDVRFGGAGITVVDLE